MDGTEKAGIRSLKVKSENQTLKFFYQLLLIIKKSLGYLSFSNYCGGELENFIS
jgi:hypothetical protein